MYESCFEPGGGGINVARAIKKLGGEATAVYPSGGYSGKFLNILLEQEKIPVLNIETKQHTRVNMIVLECTGGCVFVVVSIKYPTLCAYSFPAGFLIAKKSIAINQKL